MVPTSMSQSTSLNMFVLQLLTVIQTGKQADRQRGTQTERQTSRQTKSTSIQSHLSASRSAPRSLRVVCFISSKLFSNFIHVWRKDHEWHWGEKVNFYICLGDSFVFPVLLWNCCCGDGQRGQKCVVIEVAASNESNLRHKGRGEKPGSERTAGQDVWSGDNSHPVVADQYLHVKLCAYVCVCLSYATAAVKVSLPVHLLPLFVGGWHDLGMIFHPGVQSKNTLDTHEQKYE